VLNILLKYTLKLHDCDEKVHQHFLLSRFKLVVKKRLKAIFTLEISADSGHGGRFQVFPPESLISNQKMTFFQNSANNLTVEENLSPPPSKNKNL